MPKPIEGSYLISTRTSAQFAFDTPCESATNKINLMHMISAWYMASPINSTVHGSRSRLDRFWDRESNLYANSVRRMEFIVRRPVTKNFVENRAQFASACGSKSSTMATRYCKEPSSAKVPCKQLASDTQMVLDEFCD